MIKIGIVGIGNMGSFHAASIFAGKVEGAVLDSLCDIDRSKLDWARKEFDNQVKCFRDYEEMMDSGIDAIVIATPQYSHVEIAIKAFEKNMQNAYCLAVEP